MQRVFKIKKLSECMRLCVGVHAYMFVCVHTCMCVCVKAREREDDTKCKWSNLKSFNVPIFQHF